MTFDETTRSKSVACGDFAVVLMLTMPSLLMHFPTLRRTTKDLFNDL